MKHVGATNFDVERLKEMGEAGVKIVNNQVPSSAWGLLESLWRLDARTGACAVGISWGMPRAASATLSWSFKLCSACYARLLLVMLLSSHPLAGFLTVAIATCPSLAACRCSTAC